MAISSLKSIISNYNGADPRKDLDSVNSFAKEVTLLALDFVIVIAVIMILYSSVLYVTSYGEESRAETAKKTLTWSIIGLIVISMARVAIPIIQGQVK